MTNKVALKTVEEFMSGYVPIYQPIYPLFLGKSQQYEEQAVKYTFKRVDTVGDIRAKHITPKDTEIKQIAAQETSKVFKGYFLAKQFVQSILQDPRGLEDVVGQVLDEHQKQADDLLLQGDTTDSGSTVVNNGLFYSADANYTLKSSIQIAKGTNADHLQDLHAQVVGAKLLCDAVAGRKVILFYGATMLGKVNGIYLNSSQAFKDVLTKAIGPNYDIVELPAAVLPSGSPNGFIIANYDQVKLHYTTMPKLMAQGVNDEKMYTWHNFLMGSMMLEVLASGAIYRQPTTFEA
jgi:hypothetical protein